MPNPEALRQISLDLALPTKTPRRVTIESISQPQITFENARRDMRGKKIMWGEVPQEIRRELIENEAKELGILPPMLHPSLLSPSLTSLYEYTQAEQRKKKPNAQPDIIFIMLQDAQVNVTIPDSTPHAKVNPHIKSEEQTDLPKRFPCHPVLTREQEQTLFRYLYYKMPLGYLAQDTAFLDSFGSIDTKNRQMLERILINSKTVKDVLVFCNYRLLSKMILHHPMSRLSRQNRLDAAEDGLNKAIEKFDLEKGLKLSTFASWLIIAEIQSAIAKKGFSISLPETFIKKSSEIFRIYEAFRNTRNAEPTMEQLRQQAIANIDSKRYSIPFIDSFLDFLLFTRWDQTRYLSEKIAHDSLQEKSDFLPMKDETQQIIDAESQALDNIEEQRKQQIVGNAIESLLTLDEQAVIRAVNGFDGDMLSLADFAKRAGLTFEYATDVMESALTKLKHHQTMQEFKTGRIRENDPHVVFDAHDDGQDETARQIRAAGLKSTTIENYLTIIELRNQKLGNKIIATTMTLPLNQVRRLVLQLIKAGFIEKQRQGITPFLLDRGIITHAQLEARKKLPRDREAYISEETRAVKRYLDDHPKASFANKMNSILRQQT